MVELDVVWMISDIMNGLMAFPNLVGLLLLSGFVVRETRSYLSRHGPESSTSRGGTTRWYRG
jgi:AGCS family alanine or glycine:cation symporter